MATPIGSSWLLPLIILVVSFLYSSVGFGGASSYLAVMSYFQVSPQVASSVALTLNVIVASIAFVNFSRSKHLSPSLVWPFLVTSIPAAFLGGLIRLDHTTYQIILNAVLLVVAVRMLVITEPDLHLETGLRTPPLWQSLSAGLLLGLLSGIVGIGGGIFLSPMIMIARWGTPKQAAAASAAFIALNSLSGLAGRLLGGTLDFGTFGQLWIPVGVIGGLAGSYLGARVFSQTRVQRLLGLVILVVVLRFGYVMLRGLLT